MHSNADISYYTNETKCIWRDLICLEPRKDSTVTTVKSDDILMSMSNDICKRIPEPFDIDILKKDMDPTLIPTPTQIVLLQVIMINNTININVIN